MKLILKHALVSFVLIGITACAASEKQSQQKDIRYDIASAYGIESFDQIEQIQYTFNVKIGEKRISRFWIWEPKADRVTFKGGDIQDAISYDRKELTTASSEQLKKIDAGFINDNYWLLFPFRVAWDSTVKVEDIGSKKLPMGEESARCVVVSFPPTGGYTPGDVYELFLGNDYKITQWVYRRGGSPTPTRIATWEDYRRVGPLTLSLNHQGDDTNFQLWFTGVGVRLVGSKNWIFAN